MGKGDKKTKQGKITIGSYGKLRQRKKKVTPTPVATKKAEKPKAKETKAAKETKKTSETKKAKTTKTTPKAKSTKKTT